LPPKVFNMSSKDEDVVRVDLKAVLILLRFKYKSFILCTTILLPLDKSTSPIYIFPPPSKLSFNKSLKSFPFYRLKKECIEVVLLNLLFIVFNRIFCNNIPEDLSTS